ncbi:hypothetical protein [Beijerinckia sp. L45]|uniref:hypothetical protein n=1 Tax=Beijerinckia sp. L45 TaxID=1641855 RepID=UPI00131DD72C|nr:hypothetical protein [Beijerinckia sp. L45]
MNGPKVKWPVKSSADRWAAKRNGIEFSPETVRHFAALAEELRTLQDEAALLERHADRITE